MTKATRLWLALVFCFAHMGLGCAEEDDGDVVDRSLSGGESALLPRDVVLFTPKPAPLDGSDDGVWGNRAPTYGCSNVLFGTPTVYWDFGCRWLVVWDDTALYVYIDTSDDVQRARTTLLPWQSDSIELYIDADGSRGHRYDRVNDFQFIFAPDVERIAFGVHSVRRASGVRYVPQLIWEGAGGVTLRIAVPWSTLGVRPEPGMKIGIEIQFNDNDNGWFRDAKVGTFATTDDAWWDPNSFGLFTLGERASE